MKTFHCSLRCGISSAPHLSEFAFRAQGLSAVNAPLQQKALL
jgi:hypothetical protein